MVDMRKNSETLAFDLGLEPVHGLFRTEAAGYGYQSVCGHGVRSLPLAIDTIKPKHCPAADRDRGQQSPSALRLSF
jgi:hypothetical protein